jgi:ribosome-associated protein
VNHNLETYRLSEPHIELCSLLKIVGPFASGGEAKRVITEGLVQVDGVIETRKKCKIKVGQTVTFDELEIKVSAT